MTTSLTIDASALVDALVETDAPAIVAAIGGRELIAPAHLDAEVLSALRGLSLGGHLTLHRCRDAVQDLADLPLTRWALDEPLLARSLDFAHGMTAYDALYVSLAEMTGTPLLTRDEPLSRAAARFVEVEVI